MRGDKVLKLSWDALTTRPPDGHSRSAAMSNACDQCCELGVWMVFLGFASVISAIAVCFEDLINY
jgi:hypothetical protein